MYRGCARDWRPRLSTSARLYLPRACRSTRGSTGDLRRGGQRRRHAQGNGLSGVAGRRDRGGGRREVKPLILTPRSSLRNNRYVENGWSQSRDARWLGGRSWRSPSGSLPSLVLLLGPRTGALTVRGLMEHLPRGDPATYALTRRCSACSRAWRRRGWSTTRSKGVTHLYRPRRLAAGSSPVVCFLISWQRFFPGIGRAVDPGARLTPRSSSQTICVRSRLGSPVLAAKAPPAAAATSSQAEVKKRRKTP